MRAFLFLAGLIVALLALDAIVFDGRYRQAALQEAKYQGDKLNYQVGDWLRKSGLRR
jgi:hypothetical protein